MEVRFRLPALEPAEDGDDIVCDVLIELRSLHVSSGELYQSEE